MVSNGGILKVSSTLTRMLGTKFILLIESFSQKENAIASYIVTVLRAFLVNSKFSQILAKKHTRYFNYALFKSIKYQIL
jgi:hypothetical protein